MRINIQQLRNGSQNRIEFETTIDISDIESTAAAPISVSGEIVNRAEMLILSMTVSGERNLVCDRCALEFSRVTTVPFEACVVENLDNGDEEDGFIICEGDELEIDELAVSVFILGFETKNLCKEDCKGLCSKCGANLNEQACSCKDESIDPRLEVLKQLLDD